MNNEINIEPLLDFNEVNKSSFKDKKVALIYDYNLKYTVGMYSKTALDVLCKLTVFHPNDINGIGPDFDLYLVIDDGSHYVFPEHLKPSAFWVIDTHVTPSHDIIMAVGFDYIFCAQREGVVRFLKYGFRSVYWLPLACDPDIHYSGAQSKVYDIGFVGKMGFGERHELLTTIKNKYKDSYVGYADYNSMGEIYGRSKIVFNRSIRDDLNMRVFEGMCSGSVLLADKVGGIEDIFSENKHLFLYSSKEEAISKIDYLLKNPHVREKVAAEGRQEVKRTHTYYHRMKAILSIVFNQKSMDNQYNTFFSLINNSIMLRQFLLSKFANMFVLFWIDRDWLKRKIIITSKALKEKLTKYGK